MLAPSTGTTMDPMSKRLLEAMGGLNSADPRGSLDSLFSALTTIDASVWVDRDGVLRRLDERITMGSTTQAGANDTSPRTTATKGGDTIPALLDARLEFWDLALPLTDAVPAGTDVIDVTAIPRSAIPTTLSPCNTRIPATTR